mmetsp:Transcript_62791/g.111983  ORF Transcript_62791/g.111983 Transcript_62791/m.111983 type:complete len:245 (+) Transcript_62791:1496-2230(+)
MPAFDDLRGGVRRGAEHQLPAAHIVLEQAGEGVLQLRGLEVHPHCLLELRLLPKRNAPATAHVDLLDDVVQLYDTDQGVYAVVGDERVARQVKLEEGAVHLQHVHKPAYPLVGEPLVAEIQRPEGLIGTQHVVQEVGAAVVHDLQLEWEARRRRPLQVRKVELGELWVALPQRWQHLLQLTGDPIQQEPAVQLYLELPGHVISTHVQLNQGVIVLQGVHQGPTALLPKVVICQVQLRQELVHLQ